MGKAEASKNSKNKNKLVHAKLPTKHISEINSSDVSKYLSTSEYQAVNRATISTLVLKITNGRLKPW